MLIQLYLPIRIVSRNRGYPKIAIKFHGAVQKQDRFMPVAMTGWHDIMPSFSLRKMKQYGIRQSAVKIYTIPKSTSQSRH